MKSFSIRDMVRINNISAPQIHNRIGIIRGYNDMLDLFKLDIEHQTYMIKGCYLEKVNEEELIKKCLFENADAFDEPILTFKNGSYIKTIKSKDFEESEEKKMKEIKNQKVVDLYFKRKEKALSEEHKAVQKVIMDADKNYIFVQQLKDQFGAYVKENEIKDIADKNYFPTLPLTSESLDRVNEVHDNYRDKKNRLDSFKEEITALLFGCDTYEQEMEILRSYGIIDGNKLV